MTEDSPVTPAFLAAMSEGGFCDRGRVVPTRPLSHLVFFRKQTII